MAAHHSSILSEAMQHKWSPDLVSEKLVAEGHDEVSVNLLLREYKKMLTAKRQTTGFILATIGALLGLLSCIFTVFDLFPNHIHIVLYGLTTVAITIVFVGLYYIFE